MRIKKAKLKQIIQEELQKLSEQSPGRTPGRARGNDPALVKLEVTGRRLTLRLVKLCIKQLIWPGRLKI